MGLPYADNPSARHQIEFDNELYFEVIDVISEGSSIKLNNIIGKKYRKEISDAEFENICSDYKDFLNNVRNTGIKADATYGLSGNVSKWINADSGEVILKGGAEQYTIPLSVRTLIDLGVIRDY